MFCKWIMCSKLKSIFILFQSIFFFRHPLLDRWVGRSQPCLWTPVAKSFGPNTVKYSRPTWRPWVMPKSRMERGYLWLSKTWAAVRFTLKPSSTTLMEGRHALGPALFFFFINPQKWASQMFVSGHFIITFLSEELHLQFFHLPGLLWCVEMESTSSTPLWHWETRALVQHRSLCGHTILLSKWTF